jgi:type III restriction enzyme
MEFEFKPDLEYQLDAIASVVDLFDGQPDTHGEDPFGRGEGPTVANELSLSEAALLENVRRVQRAGGLDPSEALYEDDDLLQFAVEMETGTGKTYVYLRTIHELFAEYGWKKFVVLVPSVAIREGVLKTLDQTHEHFARLYGNPPVTHAEYDSSTLGDVVRFGNSNGIEVLVTTLQSINRGTENVMFTPQDQLQGDRPIDRIAATNPIVVMDEPQNMEGDRSREAIRALSPLCTLRYSATHRTEHNLVHRLTPVDAHDLGLVKDIEVLSVTRDTDFDRRYVRVLDVDADSNGPKAQLELYKDLSTGTKKGTKTVRVGDSLYAASNGVAPYEGVSVASIDARKGTVALDDGTRLAVGAATDTDVETIQHRQIRETVREHLEKARRLHAQGIKVLSLFFIDRVAHFRGRSGEAEGHLWRCFRETFEELKTDDRYAEQFGDRSATEVSGAYFATTTTGDVKTRASSIRDDVESYELIMRDKERLLSLDEPTQFVFSHSALGEGWDNPNVFQVCTLDNTVSTVKKRQEIGRGVRLPVRQDGTRLDRGDPRNRLTVVANESYADYAAQLQAEYEDDGYTEEIAERTHDRRDRVTVTPREDVLDGEERFAAFWDAVSPRTRYETSLDTAALVTEASDRIGALDVSAPELQVERGDLAVDSGSAVEPRPSRGEADALDRSEAVPDVVERLAAETDLTKRTVARTLLAADNFEALVRNPHAFVSRARRELEGVKQAQLVDGITYTTTGECHPTSVFESRETYADETLAVETAVHDRVVVDSETERRFVDRLDAANRVRLFVAFPAGYTVPTPYGPYTPDWGIVYREGDSESGEKTDPARVLVRETAFGSPDDPRPEERPTRACVRAHYDTLGVEFGVISGFDPEDAIETVLGLDGDGR